MLASGPPAEPSSPEFAERLARTGEAFAQAGVAAIYLVHGTFAGDDALGLLTEVERFAPGVSRLLRAAGKRTLDLALGETGNYTRRFAVRMEAALSVDRAVRLPVRLFHWSSVNNHIARADAAVRLIDQLATWAEEQNTPAPGTTTPQERVQQPTADAGDLQPRGAASHNSPRILFWCHSHGGNVLALVTNLLGSDEGVRGEFFAAAKPFYHGLASSPAFPAWERVTQVLAQPDHPLRRVQLDVVNFGTPLRYGWDSLGYSRLLHIINHRPQRAEAAYLAKYPPPCGAVTTGRGGDFVNQLGVAGSNCPPLPIALWTFLADRRLGRLLERDLPRQFLTARMKPGRRVPDDGVTLLIDYDDPDRWPLRHLLGHAPYTRSRWLPQHCELVAQEFYSP